jgi:hypothetical protein
MGWRRRSPGHKSPFNLQCLRLAIPLTLVSGSGGVRGEPLAARKGEDVLSVLMSWLLRGLIAICGVVLVYQGLPVALSALQAQKADSVVSKLRRVEPLTTPAIQAGIEALNNAVSLEPVAGRYLQRSELESGGALTPGIDISAEVRTTWLQRSKADLELGLARAPARTMDWLRLATVMQALDGPSRTVIRPLMMSIETGPWLEAAFFSRLRLIVDNWAYFSDEQKAEIQSTASGMWRRSLDPRFFGWMVSNPVDELIIRNLLRDEPGAQEKLTIWILTK